MCDTRHVPGNDYETPIIPEGGDCLQAWEKKKTKEVEKEEGGKGPSFINSPAVVETPCWTVNHH